MKAAIVSDSHDNWTALSEAVSVAVKQACDVLFFAGDLVDPRGVEILEEFTGPVHMIIGNNEFAIDEIMVAADKTDNVIYHGEVCDIGRGGLRIFMHHYPGVAEEAAQTGKYNLCIHGHLHTFRDNTMSGARVLSPGAISHRGSQPEWGIYNTETDDFIRHEVKQYVD